MRYRYLRSYNNPDGDLRQFVPARFWNTARHNDPEFASFTCGDVGENGRSAALTKMTTRDALLFLARLEGWQSGRRTGQAGFYLVGGLLAEHAGWVVRHSPQEKDSRRTPTHIEATLDFGESRAQASPADLNAPFQSIARYAPKFSETQTGKHGLGATAGLSWLESVLTPVLAAVCWIPMTLSGSNEL